MSTVDEVEAALRSRILRGEVDPGARLRQDALAEDLGVSKIPVREALQRLVASGLLRFESNRGAVLPSLTAADATENYSLRRAIEPLLLRRAIPNLSMVDLAEAELALHPAEVSVAEANWAFHRVLYRAAGWKRGLAVTEMLHVSVAPYVLFYTQDLGGAADSSTEHREILDACRDQRLDDAVALLGAHLEQAERALVTFLEESGDDPARR